MLYDVECLWPGWTTVCEVVQNGVVKKSVWCEIVKLRCCVKCQGVILNVFVVWIYKVMRSVQSSLLFLYYVVFSVCNVRSFASP